MGTTKLQMDFEIKDIKEFLKQELDFVWIDNTVKDKGSGRYRRALVEDFKYGAYICVEGNKKGDYQLVTVKVTDNQFIIRQGESKMDASKAWQEYQHELFDDIIKQTNLANAVDDIRIK